MATNNSVVSISNALKSATAALHNGVENPSLEAQILLAFCLQVSRSHLIAWPEKPLSATQAASYQQWVNRRVQGEPIAYIMGQRDFWDITLTVSPATLIPRPETEGLVELSLSIIPTDQAWQIADLGTGSGAIALAIAKHRPRSSVVAVDASAEALHIARINQQQLGLTNVTICQSNWYAKLQPKSFHLLVSNPPYIPELDSHLSQGDLRFEPRPALVADQQGLQDLRHIIGLSSDYLRPEGWLLVEHGYNQAAAVKHCFKEHSFKKVRCQTDLAGIERMTYGQI